MSSSAHRGQSFVVSSEECAEADLHDVDALSRALDGYRLVYDCLVASVEDARSYPRAARNLAIAAAKTGAKIVHVSSYWSYCPISRLPLDEEHPREGGADWAKYRREGEDALLAQGAAVAHLPELYGPLVHGSLVQRAIEDAHSTQTIRWIGPAALKREYAFAPDAMEAVVRLSYCSEALGERWIVGGNGLLSANEIAEIAGKKLNKNVRVASVGQLALKFRSLFDEKARALLQMPDPTQPVAFKSAKLQALIGPIPASSHEQGIARTIEWLDRRRRSVK
jgi:nucleoside-diphosphate-sugar epimerase